MNTPGESPRKPDIAASVQKLIRYRRDLLRSGGSLALANDISDLEQKLAIGLDVVSDRAAVNSLLAGAGREDLILAQRAIMHPLPSVRAAANNKQSESWPRKWTIWTTDVTNDEGRTVPQPITTDELDGIRHGRYPDSDYFGDVSGNPYFVRALIIQPKIVEKTVEICSSQETMHDKKITAPYLFAAHVLCEWLVDKNESGGNPDFLNR